MNRIAVICIGITALLGCKREPRGFERLPVAHVPHCGARIRGATELLERGRTLLFGDVHGSQEIPRAVTDIACEGVDRGLPLVLGLELPASEDQSIERYLGSKGSPSDRAALLSSPFWATPPGEADGRGSVAMFELVDQMRQLRGAGRSVTVFGMVQASNDYDLGMALTAERRRAEHGDALMMLFAGGNHTRLNDGFPMGARLVALGIAVISLRVVYANGTAWSCDGLCHEARIDDGDDLGAERFVMVHQGATSLSSQLSSGRSSDGIFYVGVLHTSSPVTLMLRGNHG